MFDDTIPEEREERHKKLITFLRRGLPESVAISSSEQSSIIAQVRERLMQADDLSFSPEAVPFQQPGQTRSRPIKEVSSRRRRVLRFVNVLAAVLIVGILIGTSFLLFRSSAPQQTAARPPADTPGPTSRTQVNGLEASIHLVTPGPYFLSELVSVDVSLTNHTPQTVMLPGSNKPDNTLCLKSALSARITGGSTPSYIFPALGYGCTQEEPSTSIAPDQTLTIAHYLPVTKSGEVTITMGGQLEETVEGKIVLYPGASHLLDGHWPSLHIHVDQQAPSDRKLALHAQGTQVMIQAPPAARARLLYMELIHCWRDDPTSGGWWDGRGDWTSLPTLVLSQPACPMIHKRWTYIVSAPGYSIVAGKQSL